MKQSLSSVLTFVIVFLILLQGRIATAASLRVTPLSAALEGTSCESDGPENTGQFTTTCQNMATFNGKVYFLSIGSNVKRNRLRYYSPSTKTFETAIGDSSCNTDTGLDDQRGLHVFNNELYLLNTGHHTIVKVSPTTHAMTTWIGVQDAAGNSVNVVADTNAKVNAPTRMTHLAGTLYFAQSSSTGEYELMRVATTTHMLSSVVALANTPVSLTVLHGKMLFATEVVGSPSAVLQSV
eukprot:PhM_4_TR9642/c0_g1_i1/m.3185